MQEDRLLALIEKIGDLDRDLRGEIAGIRQDLIRYGISPEEKSGIRDELCRVKTNVAVTGVKVTLIASVVSAVLVGAGTAIAKQLGF